MLKTIVNILISKDASGEFIAEESRNTKIVKKVSSKSVGWLEGFD